MGYSVVSARRPGLDPMRDALRIVGTQAGTVLDVGANHGQAARRFLDAFPQASIYSFEPLPQALRSLRALAANDPRLEVLPYALGATATRLNLNIASSDDGSSLLAFDSPGSHEWTSPAGAIEVEVKRLDAVARDLSLGVIDLLKVDTQGFDLEVLKGAGHLLTPATIRAVMVELNFASFYTGQATAGQVVDYLVGRGYRPIAVYAGSRDDRGRQTWADALFA